MHTYTLTSISNNKFFNFLHSELSLAHINHKAGNRLENYFNKIGVPTHFPSNQPSRHEKYFNLRLGTINCSVMANLYVPTFARKSNPIFHTAKATN